MLPWWWWPCLCAPTVFPAIFQGIAKVNGQEGGSNIIVGPSASSGFPGTGGGGTGGGGAGGGESGGGGTTGGGAGGEAGAAGAAPMGGGPGPGAPAGGEGGTGGGGGNSTISLTDLRGDCGVAGVGYAFVISAGSIQLGGGQSGGAAGGTSGTNRGAAGGSVTGTAAGTAGGAAPMGAGSDPPGPWVTTTASPGTFRFAGNRDTFTVRPLQSRSATTYTHAPDHRMVE